MYRIIIESGIFSTLIPIIILLFVYKKAHQGHWWVLFSITLLWFVSDVLSLTLARFGIHNMVVFQLYGILSLIGYAMIFYRLNRNVLFRRILIISIVVIEIFLISHASVNDLWFKPNMINSMTAVFVPFLLSIMFFFQLMLNPIETKLVRYPYYWISTAILIRYGMAFFAVIFIEQIVANNDLTLYLWPIVSISTIIHNLLFSRGVWLMKQA